MSPHVLDAIAAPRTRMLVASHETAPHACGCVCVLVYECVESDEKRKQKHKRGTALLELQSHIHAIP